MTNEPSLIRNTSLPVLLPAGATMGCKDGKLTNKWTEQCKKETTFKSATNPYVPVVGDSLSVT